MLVEGFKRARMPKIEVWRVSTGHEVQYPVDPDVVAICTDSASELPVATALPVLDLNDTQAVVDFLRASGARYAYTAPRAD